jgi:hypothetical protein
VKQFEENPLEQVLIANPYQDLIPFGNLTSLHLSKNMKCRAFSTPPSVSLHDQFYATLSNLTKVILILRIRSAHSVSSVVTESLNHHIIV